MGPLITRQHQQRVAGYLDIARSEGADVALDGRHVDCRRSRRISSSGPASSIACGPTMRLAREEIFGPVLSVMRTGDLEEALGSAGNARTATAPASSPAAAGPRANSNAASTPA